MKIVKWGAPFENPSITAQRHEADTGEPTEVHGNSKNKIIRQTLDVRLLRGSGSGGGDTFNINFQPVAIQNFQRHTSKVFDLEQWLMTLPQPRWKTAKIEILRAVLKMTEGNAVKAGKLLGMTRRGISHYFYNRGPEPKMKIEPGLEDPRQDRGDLA